MKLLFAEDTKDLNKAVTALLTHENYEVDSVYDGEEALDRISSNAYDCIILDIMMPRKDGLQVLSELRRRHIVSPVIMLTAKAEIEDRVAGLDAGADDYLPKPFAMKELLARIRSACRRSTGYNAESLSFGDLALDSDSFTLSAKNSIRLSVKEYELLQVLICNADVYLSGEVLLERVWRGDENADENTLNLYISYLTGKLSAVGSSVTIKETQDGKFGLKDGGKKQ